MVVPKTLPSRHLFVLQPVLQPLLLVMVVPKTLPSRQWKQADRLPVVGKQGPDTEDHIESEREEQQDRTEA